MERTYEVTGMKCESTQINSLLFIRSGSRRSLQKEFICRRMQEDDPYRDIEIMAFKLKYQHTREDRLYVFWESIRC